MKRVMPPHLMSLDELHFYAVDNDDPFTMEAVDRLLGLMDTIEELQEQVEKPKPSMTVAQAAERLLWHAPFIYGLAKALGSTDQAREYIHIFTETKEPSNDNSPENTSHCDDSLIPSAADSDHFLSEKLRVSDMDRQEERRHLLGEQTGPVMSPELDATGPNDPILDTVIRGLKASLVILDDPLKDDEEWEEIHLNSSDLLPPVDCDIIILVDDRLHHAVRTRFIASRGDDMEYWLPESSEFIVGRFPWTYA